MIHVMEAHSGRASSESSAAYCVIVSAPGYLQYLADWEAAATPGRGSRRLLLEGRVAVALVNRNCGVSVMAHSATVSCAYVPLHGCREGGIISGLHYLY